MAGCSSEGRSGSALTDLGIDDGASKGLLASKTASADEKVSIELATGAQVEIPAGAVTKNVKITMERPADEKALELVERLPKSEDRVASAPYVLTPHGTKFEKDVTVTLPVSKRGAEGGVSVAWLEDENDKQWKRLDTAVIEGDKAAVKLKHFSVLMLVIDADDLPAVDAGSDVPQMRADAGEPSTAEAGVALDDDAGDSVDEDAGSAHVDASSPDDGKDAGPGAVRDAGTSAPDASTPELDAGDEVPDTGAPDYDATTGAEAGGGPSDASSSGDAVVVVADATVGSDGATAGPPALLSRLVECDVVTTQGYLPEPVLHDPLSLCVYHCVLAGTCLEAQSYFCYGGDVAYGPQTQACIEGCSPSFFTCPEQNAGNFRCDGNIDCINGEDEASCNPPYFQCGGMILPSYARCNGYMECQGGEDEDGCTWHMCDGDVMLPPDYVCDGRNDCVDGTDEPASCAVVDCAIITQ